jgi:hypothetical protein
LVPALLLACFAAVVFWWNPFGQPPEHAYFEAILQPSVSGETGFLADLDGTGLRLEKTMHQPIKAGELNHVRFTLTAGKLCAFTFTPLAGDGEVDVYRCWFSGSDGEVVAMLPLSGVAAAFPQAHILKDGVRLPGRVGPNTFTGITKTLNPPIDLAITLPPPMWQVVLVFLGTLCAALAASRLAGRLRWRAWSAVVWHWIRLHPRRAIFLAAAASAVLSCFPVVFCGMSFISPDNGVQTFYDTFPGVPGAQGGRVENAAGSDMGATLYGQLPYSIIQHRAIFEDHQFPFWNRYTWGGTPLWAQCISMFGDPLHWPVVAAGGASWAWDMKFVIAKILFACGIGFLVWASSRSLRAALLLALSAPYIGFFAYRFCHPGFFALCYAPWLLLPWLEAIRQPRFRSVAGWAALLILADWEQLNSGTAKEASAFLLLLNAAGVLALLGARLSWGERLRRLGLFAWASVLFVLLSALHWIPFLDALAKAVTTYDAPRVYQIQPGLFIGAFDDIFYRQLVNMEFLSNPSVNFFVLLGVAWAVACGRGLARNGTFRAALIVAAFAAAVAFGVVPPDFLARLPMLKNIYHFDNTFSGVLFILLFVLAGFGLRACHRRMRSGEWRGDWVIVLSIVGVLFAAFLGLTQASHRTGITFLEVGQTIPKSEFMWSYSVGLVLALAVLPWAWRAFHLRQPAAGIWLLVAICAFATLHFRHGMYLVTRFDLYTMNPKKRLDMRHLQSPSMLQIESAVASEPARVVGFDWLLTPGFNTVFGVETISGPDALENPAMRDLTAALGIPQIWYWRLMVWRKDFAALHRSLDMLGVRYLLDHPGAGSGLPGTKLFNSSDLDVVESPTAWPRAFFTDSVATYQHLPELAQLVQKGDGRPFAAMLATDRARLPLPVSDVTQRTIVPAHHYHLTQNSTAFELDTPGAGVAVLGEAWVPGDLEAVVDGQSVPVLRIDHAFRGVAIGHAGHHTVEIGYRPEVFNPSLGVALAGLIGTLLTALLFFKGSRVSEPAPLASTTPSPAEAKLS